jgi:hypothetical protein
MKIYEGARSLEGAIVTVDGKPLPPRLDLKALSKAGFEWTYEGAGPAQLALALLADHLGDDQAGARPLRPLHARRGRRSRQCLAPDLGRYRRGAREHAVVTGKTALSVPRP